MLRNSNVHASQSEAKVIPAEKGFLSTYLFDGEPDPNSPWAKFIYNYDEDEEHQNNDAHEHLVQ